LTSGFSLISHQTENIYQNRDNILARKSQRCELETETTLSIELETYKLVAAEGAEQQGLKVL
jgi:hypothetical protein